MRITRGFGPCRQTGRGRVVSIGNFDGLHLGHQAIVTRLCEAGRSMRLPAAVVTFEPHPREFLTPETAPARLMRLRDKAAMLGQLGVDEIRVLRFGQEFAGWDAGAFIERILDQAMGARRIVTGEDFRFGCRRSGDVAVLSAAGKRLGFEVETVARQVLDGTPISSTRVRHALAAGRLDEAAALLGRRYRMGGRVIRGLGLGRGLGFPTANIRLYRRVSPVNGIYAVRASGAGLRARAAVASIGTRPTVGGGEQLLEVHVFDFDGDLYGQRLDVDFHAYLRDEIRFRDLPSLVEQMRRDAQQARELLDA